jgi:hypothetical protein
MQRGLVRAVQHTRRKDLGNMATEHLLRTQAAVEPMRIALEMGRLPEPYALSMRIVGALSRRSDLG